MKKPSQAFDDQKILQKPKQKAEDAESRCDKSALSEEELGRVSAAGDTTVPTMDPEVLLGRHARPDNNRENKP